MKNNFLEIAISSAEKSGKILQEYFEKVHDAWSKNENIRDLNGSRYLGFGRFAGIVGCYNTLNLFLSKNKFIPLGRAFKINNYERLKYNLKNINFPKIKLLVTGDGRVAGGVMELLKETNFIQVNKKDYLLCNFNEPVFCNLKTEDYVKNKDNTLFNLNHLKLNK